MEKERKSSKENRGILGIAIMLLIMLLLTGAGGYTYARYISQEKGNGSAEIAKWAFKIDKGGAETKTIKLTNTVSKDTLVNGKIAPGTSGEFKIILDARDSEVGVDYTVRFMNEKNKPTNVVFSYMGEKYKSLTKIGDIIGTIKPTGDKTQVITISWEWPYQTGDTGQLQQINDDTDTREANTISEYTFDLVAIGTQSK